MGNMFPIDHGLCEIFGFQKNKYAICYDDLDVCMLLVMMVRLHYKLFKHEFVCHDLDKNVFAFYEYVCNNGYWKLFKDSAIYSPIINYRNLIHDHFSFEGLIVSDKDISIGKGGFKQKKQITIKKLRDIGWSQSFLLEMCKVYEIEMLQNPFI